MVVEALFIPKGNVTMQSNFRYSTGALAVALALGATVTQANPWNFGVVGADEAHQRGHTGYANTADAIRYAAQAGAKVLNGSFGPPAIPSPFIDDPNNPNNRIANPNYVMLTHNVIPLDLSQGLAANLDEAKAVEEAAAKDVLMVFAAGNGHGQQPLAARNPSGLALLPYIRPENHDSVVYRFIDISQGTTDPNNPNTYSYLPSNAPGLDQFDTAHLQGSIIAVVATNADNQIASYSNRCGVASQWCIAAPGGDRDADGNEDARKRYFVDHAGQYTHGLVGCLHGGAPGGWGRCAGARRVSLSDRAPDPRNPADHHQ
jgi:subtilase-type serine protease